MAGLLIVQLTESDTEKSKLHSHGLIKQFAMVAEIATGQLEVIMRDQERKRQQLASEGRGLDGKNMLDVESIDGVGDLLDFTNVEYVTKNIRVQSEGEQATQEQSEHASKYLGDRGDHKEEEEEKYNTEILLTLADVRD